MMSKSKNTFRTLICAAAMCSIVPLSANAGKSKRTSITNLYVDSAVGMIYVTTEGAHSGRPQCSTRDRRMAIPLTDPTAKMKLATLLTAISAKRKIRLIGLNQCDSSGAELARIVVVYD